MNKNFSKYVIKTAHYGCWIAILLVSLIYVTSSSSPWPQRLVSEFSLPNIDPKVHLDTESYVLPQKLYGNARYGPPPNEHLIKKSRNFYSGVGTQYYAEVFYRPDFEQFPLETALILFFRLATYAGIVLFFFLLSKILSSIVYEDPFNPKNHARLFYLGIIALFVPIVRTLHSIVMAGFLMYDPKLLGFEVSPSYLNLWLVSVGVFIMVLSYFFKESARMYEDLKLTV